MFPGFNTSVFPENSEEVWGGRAAPERSGELRGATGSYGEVWRSGEPTEL